MLLKCAALLNALMIADREVGVREFNDLRLHSRRQTTKSALVTAQIKHPQRVNSNRNTVETARLATHLLLMSKQYEGEEHARLELAQRWTDPRRRALRLVREGQSYDEQS